MGDDILIYLSILDEEREHNVSALKLPNTSRAFTHPTLICAVTL